MDSISLSLVIMFLLGFPVSYFGEIDSYGSYLSSSSSTFTPGEEEWLTLIHKEISADQM